MEHLRTMLDRDKVVSTLEYAGYEFDRKYKFKFREERMLSAVVNVDC
jgi:hypothetical protein